MNPWFFLALLLFVYLIYSIISNRQKLRDLRRYEFNNRTDGGCVAFATFEDAEKHNRQVEKLERGTGGGLTVVAILCFLVVGACQRMFEPKEQIAPVAEQKKEVQHKKKHERPVSKAAL